MASDPLLYHYCSTTLESEFPLPALHSATAVSGEVIRVRHGATCPEGTQWSHHWRDGDDVVLSLARHGSDYWLRFPDLADFQLQMNPNLIVVAANASADDNTLEHLLVDQVLPRFLSHKEHLMAHASAVTLVGRHALFLGPSGWGKSTLAGLLQRDGHAIHSDDCVQLRISNGRCEALPTYPSLRLYSDSVEALFPAIPTISRVASYTEKLRISRNLDESASGPVPVDRIFLLGNPSEGGAEPSISQLTPSQAIQALIAHSFRLDLGDRGGNAGHFARCAAVVNAVPAFRLDYRRDFDQSTGLLNAILLHVSQLPASS